MLLAKKLFIDIENVKYVIFDANSVIYEYIDGEKKHSNAIVAINDFGAVKGFVKIENYLINLSYVKYVSYDQNSCTLYPLEITIKTSQSLADVFPDWYDINNYVFRSKHFNYLAMINEKPVLSTKYFKAIIDGVKCATCYIDADHDEELQLFRYKCELAILLPRNYRAMICTNSGIYFEQADIELPVNSPHIVLAELIKQITF